jgi:hypothetical protein
LGQQWPWRQLHIPEKDQQMHPLGTEDRMALRRLERAGKLTYADDDVRERYETMKRAGLFGG